MDGLALPLQIVPLSKSNTWLNVFFPAELICLEGQCGDSSWPYRAIQRECIFEWLFRDDSQSEFNSTHKNFRPNSPLDACLV